MTAVLGGLTAAYHSPKNSSQNGNNNEEYFFGGWISSIKYPNKGFILEMKSKTLALSNSERRSVTSHLD